MASAQDRTVANRLIDEGMNHSQVMQTAQHLTDVIGPRGDTMRTLARSIDQPRPNAKPSLWTFFRPHFANCWTAPSPTG
jgi:hypothetical protein